MFEIATRKKYRYPYKGMVTTEDLWDMNVKALDQVFKQLNRELKERGEESLLTTKSDEETDLDNKIKIIKYIVSVKEKEKEAFKKLRENAEKKQRIMSIIADKQNQALADMDIADLQKMLEEME